MKVESFENGETIKMEEKNLWRKEIYAKNVVLKFLCKKILFSKQSPYQKVEVVETDYFGRMLLNDDIIMICEKDEFVYHEMIAHVPLFLHPNPESVLIIGGGDGGSAREVLKHPSVNHCQMVEIDQMVVSACKQYIPQTAVSFSHPKLDLKIADGVKFVQKTREKYDIVLIDSTDPVGPAVPLFGESFYQNVFKILKDDGIVVAQGESPFYNLPSQKSLIKITNKLFPISCFYHFGNMTYPGGLWSFLFASKKYHPIKDYQKSKAPKMNFQYYNPDIHRGSFASPSFLKNTLQSL